MAVAVCLSVCVCTFLYMRLFFSLSSTQNMEFCKLSIRVLEVQKCH